MEKKQARRTGRKPKTDPADYKYNFRLNAQEKSRFEKLFLESGARDRTIFIKKSIFSEQLKVIKVDKVSMDYYIRLGEFYRQFQAIGNNYNQVVRAVQKNFGDKRAMSLLYINPEKPDVPLNKNDAFQKVQKRRVQEKR